jgi:hypothetical protein
LLVAAAAFAVTIVIGGIAALFALNIGQDEVPPASQTTTAAATTTLPASTTTPAPTTTAAPTTVAPPTSATTTEPPTTTVPPVQTAVAWERVPEQAGLERSSIKDVVEFDGRLVAAGYVLEEGNLASDYFEDWESDAAVWVSDDGLEWTRVGDPAALGGPLRQAIGEIVAGPDGLLAVGGEFYGGMGPGTTVVWTSPDGEAWTRAADLGDAVGFVSAAWGPEGWVVVGNAEGSARAWVSADGESWTDAGLDDPSAEVQAMVATDAGFVAVGADDLNDPTCGAIWFSASGMGWERADCINGEGFWNASVLADGRVAAYGEVGVLASDDPGDPGSWEPAGIEPVSEDCWAQYSWGPWAVPLAWDGDVGVARSYRRAMCTSDDAGETWLPVDSANGPFSEGFPAVNTVIPFDGGILAAGTDGYLFPGTDAITGGGVGAVWIGTVER